MSSSSASPRAEKCSHAARAAKAPSGQGEWKRTKVFAVEVETGGGGGPTVESSAGFANGEEGASFIFVVVVREAAAVRADLNVERKEREEKETRLARRARGNRNIGCYSEF